LSDHLPVLVEHDEESLFLATSSDRSRPYKTAAPQWGQPWGKWSRCLPWACSDNSLCWEIPRVVGPSSKVAPLQVLPDPGRVQGDMRSLKIFCLAEVEP